MTNYAPTTTTPESTPSGADTPRVADAARDVAGSVSHEAGTVVHATATQAKKFASQVGDELQEQASTQQHRVAEGIRSVGSELSTMSNASESNGMASGIVSSIGERADGVANWLDSREPADLLHEVADFARARPVVFIGLAAVVGILAGRLTRSLASDDDQASTPESRS